MSKKKKVTKTKAKRQARQMASGSAAAEQAAAAPSAARARGAYDTDAPLVMQTPEWRPEDSNAMLAGRMAVIDHLRANGPWIEAVGARSDADKELLERLSEMLPAKEALILQECGAFTTMALAANQEDALDLMQLADFDWFAGDENPPPPVAVHASGPESSSDVVLSNELRYLATVLEPAEMRQLVCELTVDHLRATPVTHTDVSDAVIASILPSVAQRYAFKADAQYKYTTAQFLQVYLKLRHVAVEFKAMLGAARADALTLAQLPFDFPVPTPSDDVPVSAVDALREYMEQEPTPLAAARAAEDAEPSHRASARIVFDFNLKQA